MGELNTRFEGTSFASWPLDQSGMEVTLNRSSLGIAGFRIVRQAKWYQPISTPS